MWLQRHLLAAPLPQTFGSTVHGMESMTLLGVWRNGSASDSRSEGWEFESLCPHFLLVVLNAYRSAFSIGATSWFGILEALLQKGTPGFEPGTC